MKRFVEGQDPSQLILLPDCLADYVWEDNPVRIVDAFIDELDLAVLGFAGVIPEATGRPSYHPVTLLKIYLYGYLNRVQSSRRLERKAQRNIELMWLTGRLAPDFKTIADFGRDKWRADPGGVFPVCGVVPPAGPVHSRRCVAKGTAEQVVKQIRRATRRQFSAEEKIRIVLSGLRGEDSIAELCRREGIVQNLYYRWSKEFLEAGKKRLAGDTARAATSDEVKDLRREASALKEVVAELMLENRLLKKSTLGAGEHGA
jgi:transposase/transposase-like protein